MEHLQAGRPWIRPIRAMAPRPQQLAPVLHGVEHDACHKVPHRPVDGWAKGYTFALATWASPKHA